MNVQPLPNSTASGSLVGVQQETPKVSIASSAVKEAGPVEQTKPASRSSPSTSKLSNKDIQETLNKALAEQKSSVSLNFDVAQDGSLESIQLLDVKTKEVIMQFPSEAVLQIRARLEEMAKSANQTPSEPISLSGLLLSQEV